MKRDDIFTGSGPVTDFEFDEEVAAVFDDMLVRSVPFYSQQQVLIREIARKFWQPGTAIYDLGCSTATTLIGLAEELPDCERLVGYDSSVPMLEKARTNVKNAGLDNRIELLPCDFNDGPLSLENAGIVTLCWTLQFVRPLERDRFMRRIYEGMAKGGALVVTEKVLTNDSNMNRFFIDFYYEFKRRNGYSEAEILRKREALENVLVPYRVDENFEMFRRSGFNITETFFQWFNFAGFLCVK